MPPTGQLGEARNLEFSVHGPEFRRAVIVDAVRGDVLLERDEGTGARRWLLRLHESFHAGQSGEVVVALCSVVLLGRAVSGFPGGGSAVGAPGPANGIGGSG